jgi:hypothetical protein
VTRYPWDSWHDGNWHYLYMGRDFSCAPESLQDQAYRAASKRGMLVSTTVLRSNMLQLKAYPSTPRKQIGLEVTSSEHETAMTMLDALHEVQARALSTLHEVQAELAGLQTDIANMRVEIDALLAKAEVDPFPEV